jgi:hypothetical protein
MSVIFIQSLSFTPLLEIASKSIKRKGDKTNYLAIAIACNLLILSTIYYVAALIGLTGYMAGLIVCLYLFMNLILELITQKSYKFIFTNIFKNAIFATIAIFQILPAIVKLSQANVILGAATTGNNDISSYALVSKAFLINGFNSQNLIYNVNLNSFAETSAYQTPNFVVSFLAMFFDNSPLRIMVLAQVIILSFVSICFFEFIRYFAPKANEYFLRMVSSFVMLFPLNNYIVANYFLAHILSLGVLALLLLTLLKLKDLHSLRNILEASVALALNIYVYPPVAFPLFLIFCFIVCVAKFTSLKDLFVFSQKLLQVFFIGLILTAPYLVASIKLLRAQSEVLAGWPIPAMSPMAALIWPQLIGWVLPLSTISVLWLFMFLVLFISTNKFANPREHRFLVVLVTTFFFVFIVYLQVSSREVSDYQSWKLLSFFICFFVLVAVAVACSIGKQSTSVLFILVGLLSSTPMIEWWPALIARNNVSSEASLSLKNDAQISNLSILNLDVGPYFRTMNIASELLNSNKTIYLNSQSYYLASSNPSACTIVENSDSRANIGRKINSEFALVPSVDKSCDPFADNLK